MHGSPTDNPTQQYIENPFHYNFRDAVYEATLSGASKFHPSDTLPGDGDHENLDLGQNESAKSPILLTCLEMGLRIAILSKWNYM